MKENNLGNRQTVFALVSIFMLISIQVLGQGSKALLKTKILNDSLLVQCDSLVTQPLRDMDEYQFKVKQIVVPSALIAGSIYGLRYHYKDEILVPSIFKKYKFDDYTQYLPMVSVYALNAFGNKGRHNFGDRTIILGTAYLLMGVTVGSIKRIAGVRRPDGSANNSYPSGHTATAFMAAEFLYQEYKHKSLWYGVAGYIVATGTAYMRLHNNKHWLGDVTGGAGIGILSTKAAYWLYPFMKEKVFKSKKRKNSGSGMIMPYYNGSEAGLGMNMQF